MAGKHRSVGKLPVKLPGLAIKGSHRKHAIPNPRYRHHLGIVTRGKNLVGGLEFSIRKRFLNHSYGCAPKKTDHALARNAGEESAVWDGRENYAMLCHKNVRGRQFRNI